MRIFIVLSIVSLAKAAYFDINGTTIIDGDERSPEVYWPELLKNQTYWNGAATFYQYPFTFIKTWAGDKPANDTPAYGIMHPDAFADADIPTSVARVLNNVAFAYPDQGVQMNR